MSSKIIILVLVVGTLLRAGSMVLNNVGNLAFLHTLAPDARGSLPWTTGSTTAEKGHSGQFAHALLLSATRLNRHAMNAWASLGVMRVAQQDLRGGATALQRIPPTDTRWPLAQFYLGFVAEQTGNPSQAIEYWREANAAPFFISRTKEWRAQQRLDRAIADVQFALQIDSQQITTHYGALVSAAYQDIAHFNLAQQHYQDAVAAFIEARRYSPDDCNLIIALGQALRHAGDSSGAEHLWRAGIHSDNATCYARTYEALAFLYSEEGRLEEAERMFRAAIAQSPTMQLDLIHLGSILQRQGRLEQAEEVLRQALIVESPNHRAWAYDSLSAVYQQQQRWHEAIEASQAAIALAPGSIHYYHRLIEIYHSTGRLQDKTQACETVRKLPDNAEIPATCR